jgi:hypothetical protein
VLVDQADVVVAVDQRRDHRLPCEIDASCSRWDLPFPFSTNPRERLTINEERGVLDRRGAVAGDQSRTFEQRRSRIAALESLESGTEQDEGARQHASEE